MVEATSEPVWYQTQLTNRVPSIFSDTTRDTGGSESGFRPHNLLEAALASCLNITLRMYADQHGLALSGVTTRVTLDRSNPEETIFEYEVELLGELSEQDRARLLDVGREVSGSQNTLEAHDIPRDSPDAVIAVPRGNLVRNSPFVTSQRNCGARHRLLRPRIFAWCREFLTTSSSVLYSRTVTAFTSV